MPRQLSRDAVQMASLHRLDTRTPDQMIDEKDHDRCHDLLHDLLHDKAPPPHVHAHALFQGPPTKAPTYQASVNLSTM